MVSGSASASNACEDFVTDCWFRSLLELERGDSPAARVFELKWARSKRNQVTNRD
jgi:hypothetical protein